MQNRNANAEGSNASGDAWLGGILIVSAISIVAFSQYIPALGLGDNSDPGPKAFPVGLAIILGIGGGIEIWKSRLLHKNKAEKSIPPNASPNASKTVFILLGLFLAYIVALPWLGFSLSTLIIANAMMLLLGNSWLKSLIASLVLITVIYLLFVRLFKVPLPGGLMNLPF